MMNDYQIFSWIFLAIALASQKEPIDYKGISMIADGINHSIPNEKEIRQSIIYLLNNNLISQIGKKYTLSEKGNLLYQKASEGKKPLLSIWEYIEIELIDK
ncbi:MAG: hypothetical protein PHC28_06385 [Flavobacterium sp.]|uniref:hypothetical protein n=1 Tax=Flavobacterium sp. TaxID=239 RepID=UPI0026281E5D|nr:hypothetical protein [Flavobacterium sp.]MDD5150098.1 hypothetical protein [Flavobacterium sp.]